ncbi:hypothetical protein GCM10009550_09060 [Actinocorallia libanotica]|uniref:Uncharacterized protein n=1 Tax=Actinocorallia libanotica TaxID=46162 RepID=A0ABN1QAU8_9ACTN
MDGDDEQDGDAPHPVEDGDVLMPARRPGPEARSGAVGSLRRFDHRNMVIEMGGAFRE